MYRQVRGVPATALTAALLIAATAVAPAAARTAGKESFKGVIVASGDGGVRTVVSSTVVAKGVFTGAGRIVEIPNRPGDADNVSRDDIVFGRGTLHIVNTNQSFKASVNPQTCAFKVRIEQTTKIAGGTGRFSHASGDFAGTVRAWGVTARAADGSCSQDLPSLVEADVLKSRGTLLLG